MERLKQFLAFPLLGTVIWLMWVLGIQLGTDAWLVSSSALLLMSLAVWLAALKPKYSKWVGVLVAGLTILWSLNFIARARPSSVKSYISTESESSQYGWVKYDRGRIERARTAGQMVFVDFTAAWCITCQVNKKAVLETDKVLSIFKSNNVLIMQADWTNQDPEITKALAEFDRNSVPVYLFYGKNGAKPVILPQILTLNIIENLFAP